MGCLDMLQTKEYLQLVEENIKNYDLLYNQFTTRDDLEIIQVCYCKTVQNHKGLFIVRNNAEGVILPYFIEATYNGDAKELYLDFYVKHFKQTIKVD